jgi:imidazolonepropionase-like amidohydrolase
MDCGVDVIDHGYVRDDEAVRVMVTNWNLPRPTLCVTQLDQKDYEAAGWPSHMIENRSKLSELYRKSFLMALEASVMMASGEDMGSVAKHAPREIELLVECGMGALDALRSATAIPARMCGLDDQLGTVEVGKWADLIATRENPLDCISAVRSVVFVMKGGKVIRQDSPPHCRPMFNVSGGILRHLKTRIEALTGRMPP